MPKKTIRKVASVVNAALRDAELARRSAHDPQFHRDVQQDRRGTLSRYTTVQHALRDRAAASKADTPTPDRKNKRADPKKKTDPKKKPK